MDIAAAVGAERLREIMGTVFDLCASVVQRYGGTVDKFTGDGIMALFGAPIALEDHAFRSCLAALDIQQGITHLAGEATRRDGVELRLRVGLHSGQVITGEIGSGRPSYTAIGEQVGMCAARYARNFTTDPVELRERSSRRFRQGWPPRSPATIG